MIFLYPILWLLVVTMRFLLVLVVLLLWLAIQGLIWVAAFCVLGVQELRARS